MSWDFLNAQDTLAPPYCELGLEWDLLNGSLFNSHPLLSHAFVGPLIRHFAPRDLLVGRLRQNGHSEAMVLVQPRGLGLWQTFLPGQAQISPVLPSAGLEVSSLLKSLPGFAIGIDFLCQDPLYTFLGEDTSAVCREQQHHCTTTAVSTAATFEDYWDQRPKKLRSNLKRYLGRTGDDGRSASINLVSDRQNLPAALGRYGILESSGWKGKAGTAIHPENRQGRFYAEVLDGFSAFNGARVYELYLGDHLAASRLCVCRGGMLVALKTTYDEELAHLAPGRLLLYKLLEREFREKEFTTIEFYTNANHDSISWATSTREIVHQSYYRYRAIRSLIVGTRRFRHPSGQFA